MKQFRSAPMHPRTLARGTAAAVATLLALFAGAACSGNIDISTGASKGIRGPNLEKDIADRVTEVTGSKPESVDCPKGLDAEIGATSTCEMVHDGVRATLAIEATSVDEETDSLDFSWKVKPGSQSLLTDHVRDVIGEAFAEKTGLTLTSVVCSEPELDGTAGTTMTCEASTANGPSGPIVLTVRGSEGMRVDFSWRLSD